MLRILLLTILLFFSHISRAQDFIQKDIPAEFTVKAGGLIAETHADSTNRQRQSLNGDWKFRFDEKELGLTGEWYKNFELYKDWETVKVPGAWDLEHPDGFHKETAGWYALEFEKENNAPFHKLKFDGVFREAMVWLNGHLLGTNEIPYLPFAFEISEILQEGKNYLVVRIDNRLTFQSLPCDTKFHEGKHGWFPYGGILREVYIESGMECYVAQVQIQPSVQGKVKVDVLTNNAFNELSEEKVKLSFVCLSPDGEKLQINSKEIPARQGMWSFHFDVKNPELWSPEKPENIYRLQVAVQQEGLTEITEYDFAFKEFKTEWNRLFLNGEDIFLRGINRHEDHPDYGPVYNEAVIDTDLALINEMQANFIRPGHYPNHPKTLQKLEAAGLMIAEEIPVYQLNKQQMKNEVLVNLCENALKRMIIRDYNRPGIVMWSAANEIHYWRKSARSFLSRLYSTAKTMDPQREVMTARLTLPRFVDFLLKDRSSHVVDVIGFNMYFGWYIGKFKSAYKFMKKQGQKFPDQPLFLSEYGAGAKNGRHAEGEVGNEKNKDHSYTEEFQELFHRKYMEYVDDLVHIRGTMPWVLADFRMEWNPNTGKPHPANLMNLKGLVSYEREKKKAFEFYKEQYTEIKNRQP